MRHNMESCDQGGKDQDEAWLDGPVASVKGVGNLGKVLAGLFSSSPLSLFLFAHSYI
jgi:hypothetical protein